MNFLETSELIKLLKASGATHFKSGDFEVHMGASYKSDRSEPSAKDVAHPVPEKESAEIENPEATEKLKELIQTMSLSPEALVDKIFPAGAGI